MFESGGWQWLVLAAAVIVVLIARSGSSPRTGYTNRSRPRNAHSGAGTGVVRHAAPRTIPKSVLRMADG